MLACNAAQVYAYKVVDELGTNNISFAVGRKEDKLTHSKDLKPEKGDNCYDCSRYVSLDNTTVVYCPRHFTGLVPFFPSSSTMT